MTVVVRARGGRTVRHVGPEGLQAAQRVRLTGEWRLDRAGGERKPL
ncbi:hypothetical protein MWU75_13010 [Ornithinimicrobium sp. F0845]|nr:hypothetical protein [Ornithinimicrobium sp. F0845]MCK0113063.1 hypothetical protein [Ornithinimicrobium sp. F0845]